MEKINVNVEQVMSALFLLGFDKFDTHMYTSIIADLCKRNDRARTVTLDEKEYECKIEFIKDGGLSSTFLSCIDITPCWIKLKNGCDLQTNIAPAMGSEHRNYTFENYISSLNNRLLAGYISQYVDLKDIVIQKIKKYSEFVHQDDLPDFFSDKERGIILDIFGINDMFRRNAEKSQAAYQMIYDQEEQSTRNAVKTLKRIGKKKKK
jgi:hypothetical protein